MTDRVAAHLRFLQTPRLVVILLLLHVLSQQHKRVVYRCIYMTCWGRHLLVLAVTAPLLHVPRRQHTRAVYDHTHQRN